MRNPFRRKAAPEIARTSQDIERMIFAYAMQSAAGISVTAEAAMECVAVRACVDVLSKSIAQMPLPLYRKSESGDREKAKDHPLYNVLANNPNSYQTSYEFRRTMQANAALHERAYAHIVRVRGEVKELLPIHPDAVTPIMNDNYTVTYRVAGKNGSFTDYKRGEILVLHGMAINGFMPEPRYKQCRQAIAVSLAAERHAGLFFKNGAKAAGAWKIPTTLSEEAYQRLKVNLDGLATGEDSHTNPLLEGGLEWQDISNNARDSQLIEVRKFQIVEIARAWGIQPHIIQSLESSTNNNIEHQGLEFVTHTLIPWARMWEQAIHKDLLTETEKKDYFAEFNFDSYLRGDHASRSAFYSTMTNNGLMDRNEARALENLPAREGADELTVQVNLVPISQLGEQGNEEVSQEPIDINETE